MKRIIMSFALLAGLVIGSASEMGIPGFAAPAVPANGIRTASAAVRSLPGPAARRLLLPVALPRFEAATPQGYAIPADHPRPPLGRFKLTAYSGPQQGGVHAITATGTSARAGRTVAVDPRVIPLGSRVYIDGLGERIAEDVGGGVKGQHIDVYLSSVPQARRFGVQRRTVTVVAPPPEDAS